MHSAVPVKLTKLTGTIVRQTDKCQTVELTPTTRSARSVERNRLSEHTEILFAPDQNASHVII